MSRDMKTKHSPLAIDEATIGLRAEDDSETVITMEPSFPSIENSLFTAEDAKLNADDDDNNNVIETIDSTFEFASGRPQNSSCVTFCGDCSSQSSGKQHTRIVPCFMNTPIKWFRINDGDSPYFESCGYQYCFRIGNFTILCQKNDVDRSGSRQIMLMVGPFWPFCLIVTVLPTLLIPVLIMLVFWRTVNIFIMITLAALMVLALVSLACVACRDPGILRLTKTEPQESMEAREKHRIHKAWTWNDQAQTWRPSGAVYDRDVNAVVKKFDHVCPFTGTAIGANNMRSFNFFTIAIQLLGYYAIFVTGYSIYTARLNGYQSPM